MKAFTIPFAIIAAGLVTGCSNGTAASSNQQPQIVYQGDSPEAARYKAHTECLKKCMGKRSELGQASRRRKIRESKILFLEIHPVSNGGFFVVRRKIPLTGATSQIQELSSVLSRSTRTVTRSSDRAVSCTCPASAVSSLPARSSRVHP